MRKQNGITLVALIITIVVLLILAVVALGVVGETNIVNYAQNAATDYNSAKADEEQEVGHAEDLLGNIVTNVTVKPSTEATPSPADPS